jgi:protein phosphatase
VREGNEDRVLVRESQGIVLLAVADGVGGGPGGEVAADAAVQELASRFFDGTGSLEERLTDAFREANTAVLRAADASGMPAAASTLVAAAVRGDRAIIANLGDSRAYLVRSGAARQLTQDHSGDIAHGITRFVGDDRGVQPDVFVEDLLPGDRLLLCSDGLTRHVNDEEIGMTLIGAMRMATLAADTPPVRGRKPELEASADTLVGLANSRGGEDNITVALYERGGGAHFASSPRPGLGLGILVALVAVVVAGTIALLISLAPYAPTSTPGASPSASASASATASPSPSPTPTPSPTEQPTPTP